MRHLRPRLADVSLLALLLLACHASRFPSSPAQSSRHAYLLESSTGADLLKGTTVYLHFGGGDLSLEANCNSMSGPYELKGDRVVLKQLFQTEMGCDPQRHAQDAWLGRFFRATPRLSVAGGRLTFAGDSARLVFVDRETADPDRPLRGTVWEVNQYIDGDGERQRLRGRQRPRSGRVRALGAEGRRAHPSHRRTLAHAWPRRSQPRRECGELTAVERA